VKVDSFAQALDRFERTWGLGRKSGARGAGVLLLSLKVWLSAHKVLSASPALMLRDSV
jgi:hypothetical protein